jgi:hypothetical protein
MGFWDSITSGVSGASNGLTDLIDKLGNTSAGQSLLDLGAKYAQGEIDKSTYDAQVAALQAGTSTKLAVPAWAWGIGIGAFVLLLVALFSRRK